MERKWNIYLKWCKQENLDPYNMETLACFEEGMVVEDWSGQIILEADCDMHYSNALGGYIDLSDDIRPRTPLTILCE